MSEKNLAQVIAETHNWLQSKVQAPGVCPLEFQWKDHEIFEERRYTVDEWLGLQHLDQFMNMAGKQTIVTLQTIQVRCEYNAYDYLDFGEMFYRTFHEQWVKNSPDCRYTEWWREEGERMYEAFKEQVENNEN